MKRLLVASATFVAALGVAVAAIAQPVYPLSPSFAVRPAMPESMPTVEPFTALAPDVVTGTAVPTVTATPGCGAANPQGGVPSMVTGTCP